MIRLIVDTGAVIDGVNVEGVGGLFKAEKFQLNLTERSSTATITVGPDAPEISIGDLLQDLKDPGAGIVWRVKSISRDYVNKTRTVNCEHAICSLKDFIAFGEITPAVVTGNSSATECSNQQMIQYALNKQYPDVGIGGELKFAWRLGGLTSLVSAAYEFNSDDVYSILETVSSTMHRPWWSYSFDAGGQSGALSITEPPEDVACELRLSRNMQSLQISEDRSRMYTRIFPIGKEDLRLSEQYLQKNQTVYGLIDHTETNESMATEASLRKWAQEELDKYCEPVLTITVNARDLSGITGEDLDRLQLGASCRIVLPDEGKTIIQQIVSLKWNDKENDRTNVQIQLANVKDEATAIIKRQAKQAKSGGRSRATTSKKNSTKISDNTKKIDNSLKDVTLSGPVNNVYTLKKQYNSGTIQQIGTFSRAVTSWRTSASAGRISVTAVPQEQTKEIRVKAGEDSWSQAAHQHTGPILYSSNGGASWTNTGLNYSVNAAADYNYGRESVRLADPVWANEPSASITGNSNTVTVSTTGRSPNISKEVPIYMSRGDWSDGRRYVYVTQSDSEDRNRVARIDVDAHMYDPSWATSPSSSITGNSNTVTVSAATGQSKSISLIMTRGDNWSNGTRYVYVNQVNSDESNRVARIDVSIPNPTNLSSITTYGNTPPSGGYSFGQLSKGGITAGKYMSMTARFGGKTFTFYFQVVA